MPMTRKDASPLPDVPLKPAAFLLLVSLAAGDRHGYALRREVSERSNGTVKLGPASLYRTIAFLLEGNWIEESGRRPAPELDDERRRYYRITDRGRQVLTSEVRRLEALTAAARAVIPVRARS